MREGNAHVGSWWVVVAGMVGLSDELWIGCSGLVEEGAGLGLD